MSTTEPTARHTHVAVLTEDVVAEKMAGPAIRAWRLAEQLATVCEVRLASTSRCDLRHESFDTGLVDRQSIGELLSWSDVVVIQGWLLAAFPEITRSDVVVVVDAYDPMHLEQLEQARDGGAVQRDRVVTAASAGLVEQLARADFVICASEEQRDFWLGTLAAIGRINVDLYDDDPTYRSFIDVVPFGIDPPPPSGEGALRGVVEGIGRDDQIVLWNGGVYNWFDPVSLIRAVHLLEDTHPNLRLVFLGMRHPNPGVPAMQRASDAVAEADTLGMTGRSVFFNHDWVELNRRHLYLLDASVVASTHEPGIETDFSFRTRVLDAIWASVPLLVTRGGALSRLVAERELGVLVEPHDVAGIAAALEQLLSPDRHERFRAALVETAEGLRWPVVAEPLVRFCAAPRRAPDRVGPRAAARRYEVAGSTLFRHGLAGGAARLLHLLDRGASVAEYAQLAKSSVRSVLRRPVRRIRALRRR
jgi:glycosyltransferase involved in cell wall biosynthesis